MNDAQRREQANQALTTHDIDTAMPLLLALEAPQLGLDFFLLFWTAQAFFDKGRHDEAYALFRKLFNAFPRQASQNAAAVKSVRAIEQQRGGGLTLVPVVRRSYRSWVIGLVTGVPVTLALLVAFSSAKKHQPLHLFNPVAVGAEVSIDGQPHRLTPRAHEVVSVAEGRHEVTVKLDNGIAYQTAIVVENTALSRLVNSNAFIFDVLGAGAFEVSTNGGAPVLVYAGRDFLVFHHLHYVFTDPAADRTRESDDHSIYTALQLSKLSPMQVVSLANDKSSNVSPADARVFSEGLIRGGERDPAMIAAYRMLGMSQGWGAEAADLLRRTMK